MKLRGRRSTDRASAALSMHGGGALQPSKLTGRTMLFLSWRQDASLSRARKMRGVSVGCRGVGTGCEGEDRTTRDFLTPPGDR